jgi:peptide deformylase
MTPAPRGHDPRHATPEAPLALRPVLKFPDPRLREVSQPVGEITDALRELARDMSEVMYAEPGIGLAAPQVGESWRLIVVDTQWTEEGSERSPLILVNPVLSEAEGKITWKEGCLSVPDFEAEVERAERILLVAHDLEGAEVSIRAEGLQAVCFQHEVDHLDGKLFIDRISHLKRSRYVLRRRKQLRQEQEEGETAGAGST